MAIIPASNNPTAISLGCSATSGSFNESIEKELAPTTPSYNPSGTATISMNDPAVRTLLGVPSGQISFYCAYGKSNRISVTKTYSSSTTQTQLSIPTIPGYVAGKSDITVNINPGIYIHSTLETATALVIFGGASGDTVRIVNNGYILGKGGAGGYYNAPVSTFISGTNGGGALQFVLTSGIPITINNINGVIGGGGGGGAAIKNPILNAGIGGGGGAGGGRGGYGWGPLGYLCGGAGGCVTCNVAFPGVDGSVYQPYPTSGGQYAGVGGGGGGFIAPGTNIYGTVLNAVSSSIYQEAGGKGGPAGGAGGAQAFQSAPGSFTQGGAGMAVNPGGVGYLSVGPPGPGSPTPQQYAAGGGGGWGHYGGGATGYGPSGPVYGGYAGLGAPAVYRPACSSNPITWVCGNTCRVYGTIV